MQGQTTGSSSSSNIMLGTTDVQPNNITLYFEGAKHMPNEARAILSLFFNDFECWCLSTALLYVP